MRIWDIHPGYLNRQSLLGEHRELHGIVSIISKRKKGYSRHPETLRWMGHGWALKQRHRLLAAEMKLRGYVDRSPVRLHANAGVWPSTFIDLPADQFAIMTRKYQSIEQGRIPLPRDVQQLWAQHKYSVMARDVAACKSIGRWVASNRGKQAFSDVSLELTRLLRMPPADRLIHNALLHMWGYVSAHAEIDRRGVDAWPMKRILVKIQQISMSRGEDYLLHSTSLSDLDACGWNKIAAKERQ